MTMRAILLSVLLLLAAVPALAEKIELENSDGTISRLKGTNGAAHVSCDNCSAEGGAAVAEDEPHVSGENGILFYGVRSGGSTTFADTNGDRSPVAVNSVGHVYTTDTKATDNGVSTASTSRVTVAVDSGVCNPKDAVTLPVSVSTSGNNELVALTSGQTVYVCDMVLVARGAVEAQFIYGTGTACATGETNMSGPMSLIANTGFSNSPTGRFKTATANALCLELSAAVQVDGYITYRKVATF
jgi:hypothetical protein